MPRVKKQRLKRRKDGRYCCRYKDQWFMGWTEDEALQAREEYKKAEALGQLHGMTVFDYAVHWLGIAKANVSAKTYAECAVLMNKLTDEIGAEYLRDIVPTQILAIYSKHFAGLSDSYIKHGRQLYCAMFDAAVADGYCEKNPARDKAAQPPKGTNGSHRAITAQERRWIETLCTDHRAWPAVMAMLYAGLRPQEMKALNISESVDFDSGTICLSAFAHLADSNHYEITNKGKTERAARIVPLFPPLRQALKGRNGMLVTNEDGTALTISGWKRLWESYVNSMERAINGMPRRWYGKTREHKRLIAEKKPLPPWISFAVVPYDLRHSFCTMCRDNGVEINTCIHWMGHADATMVLHIYDEFTQTRSAAEAKKVESTLFGRQNGRQTNKNRLKTMKMKRSRR